MSMPEVIKAVQDWEIEDEQSQSPGFCRRSAKKILDVARRSDKSEPHVSASVVVWPKPSSNEDVHYAVVVSQGDSTMILNATPSAGFPIYHGPIQTAPGLLARMTPTDDII